MKFSLAALLLGFSAWATDEVPSPRPESCAERLIGSIIRKHQYYEVNRDLESYGHLLGSDFLRRLLKLGPSQHWLDAGGGAGHAGRNYFSRFVPKRSVSESRLSTVTWDDHLRHRADRETVRSLVQEISARPPSEKARVTVVSKEVSPLRADEDWEVPDTKEMRLMLKTGRFFEEIPAEELGSADLITDLYGVFAYAAQPDLIMKRYLELLTSDGAAYVLLGRSKVGNGHAGSDFGLNPTLVSSDGRSLNFIAWLRSIEGVEVQVERVNSDRNLVARITKTGEAIRVPALKLLKVEEARPPIRHYEVEGKL